MTNFPQINTYADLLRRFDRIGDRLHASRKKLRCANDDARHVAIFGMQTIVAGYAMGFSSMIYNRSQNEVIASFGNNNLTADGARQTVEDAWKNGMLTLFHFKIDFLLQALLNALGNNNKRMGFECMTKNLKNLEILTDQQRNALTAFGYIRNSFHNNGIHHGKDLSIKIEGLQFNFHPTNLINCASWPHIFAIIYESVEIIDKILASDKIEEISQLIEDPFVRKLVDEWEDPVDYEKGYSS